MARERNIAPLVLTFHGDTVELLHPRANKENQIVYPLHRRASIKDIIESLGIPHSEVGAIFENDREVVFETVPKGGDHFHIHPIIHTLCPTAASLLRPLPLALYSFMVDINVSKLVNLLRMAGFDACTVPHGSNRHIANQAVLQKRILLTRNRELLKHRNVVFGRLIRNQEPFKQLAEIINLYNIKAQIIPFSRCMKCNGILKNVEKEEIIDMLLPLTKKYYSTFVQCGRCRNIYWRGSHHEKMVQKIHSLMK